MRSAGRVLLVALSPLGCALPAPPAPPAPPAILQIPPPLPASAPDSPVQGPFSITLAATSGDRTLAPTTAQRAPRVHWGEALVLDCRGSLRLWPLARGARHPSFGGPPLPGDLDPEAYWPWHWPSGDGKTFLTWDGSTFVRWEVATGTRRETRARGHFISASRDAGIVEQPAPGGGVVVRYATTGGVLSSLRALRPSEASTLTPDGLRLFVRAAEPRPGADLRFPQHDVTLSMFDVRSGRKLWSRGPIYDVADYVVSDDGRRIIVADRVTNYDETGPIRAWDAATGRDFPPIAAGSVDHWRASPDGATLLTHGSHDGVAIWDLATGKLRGQVVEADGADDAYVALDAAGHVAATLEDGKLRFYTLDPLRRIREVDLSSARIGHPIAPQFVAGGRALAFTDRDTAWLARVRDGALLRLDVAEVLSPGGARSCAAVVSTPEGVFDGDDDALGFVTLEARRSGAPVTIREGPEVAARRRPDLLADFLAAEGGE